MSNYPSNSRPPPQRHGQQPAFPSYSQDPTGFNPAPFDANSGQSQPYGQRDQQGYGSGYPSSQASYGTSAGGYNSQQQRPPIQIGAGAGINPQSFSSPLGMSSTGVNPSQLGSGGINPSALGGNPSLFSTNTGVNPSDLLARMDNGSSYGANGMPSSSMSDSHGLPPANGGRVPSGFITSRSLPTTIAAVEAAMQQNTIQNIAHAVGYNPQKLSQLSPQEKNALGVRFGAMQRERGAQLARQHALLTSGDPGSAMQGLGQGHPSQGRGGTASLQASQLAIYNQQLAASQNAQQHGLERPGSSQRMPSHGERMPSNGVQMPPPASIPRPNTASSIARPSSAMARTPTMANGTLPRATTASAGAIPRPPSAMSRSNSQMAGDVNGISRPPTAGSGMMPSAGLSHHSSELDMGLLVDRPPSRTGTSHSMHIGSPSTSHLPLNLSPGDLSMHNGTNRAYGDGFINGHGPPPHTPKLQTQGISHPTFPQSMIGSPAPDSPFQGLKRKAGGAGLDSPQLSNASMDNVAMNGGMGPPTVPRQNTGDFGHGMGFSSEMSTPATSNGGFGPDSLVGAMALNNKPLLDAKPMASPVRSAAVAAPAAAASMAPRIVPDLPPLPSSVRLNPNITSVTAVPLKDSLELIPTLDQAEIQDVKVWLQMETEYDKAFTGSKTRALAELAIVDQPTWWENGAPGTEDKRYRADFNSRFDIRYAKTSKDRERDRERERERERASRDKVYRPKREGLRLPRRISAEDANRPELLVPIRLEFDVEHHKMRDTFIWNLNDPVVTPENFAQSIVDDYGLGSSYHSVIVKSLQDQLSDFQAHISTSGVPEAQVEGTLNGGDAIWWTAWRKRVENNKFVKEKRAASRSKTRKRRKVVKTEIVDSDAADDDDADMERPMDVDEFRLDEKKMPEDLRVLIKLDIIVGSVKLDDQFEWDLDNADSSPEQFAEIYAQELGLAGEFKTAIAHCIREQVQTYQKSLYIVGRPTDGSVQQDEDLRSLFLPSLTSGARANDQVTSFTPLLNYMSDSEIERNEKEREKDLNKRRKRNTRGRRVAMPEREAIRTCRTPAIGFPDLDPSILAAVAAANAPLSRRAAAAAASLTIANMVAVENGETHMPMQSQRPAAQPVASSSKEKKQRGIFKPPAVPASVLRPRATIIAPTPSTGLDADSTSVLPATTDGADGKQSRLLQIKKSRETERENKEKEYADGQHANMIDDVWHCSNCGCPESIAVGRRKGPLGVKTQCGECGKYWHRHHRPKPVEWNSDFAFHKAAQQQASAGRRRGLRVQESTVPSTPAEEDTAPEEDNSSRGRNTQALSPISSVSSASESPLASRLDLPNEDRAGSSAPPSAPKSKSSGAPPASAGTPRIPPDWLLESSKKLQGDYPNDLWEITPRKLPVDVPSEWRIRCTDCPGKLYTPGPGNSLDNYEVHLKNRAHRQKVAARLNGIQPESASSGA